MSTSFQAIVVRPSLPAAIGKQGLETTLKVWMPPVGDLSVGKLDVLQGAFNGELEIVPKPREGRVLIIQRCIAFSHDGIRRASRKLALAINDHLGIPATIQ